MKSLVAFVLTFSSLSVFASETAAWYCSGKNLSPLANRVLSRAIDHMDLSHPEALGADPTYVNDATLEALRATFAEGDARRSSFPQEINNNISQAAQTCRTNACVKATYSKLVAHDFCQ